MALERNSAAKGMVTAVSRSNDHKFSKANVGSIWLRAGLGVEGDAHAGALVQHGSRVAAADPSQPNLRQVGVRMGMLQQHCNHTVTLHSCLTAVACIFVWATVQPHVCGWCACRFASGQVHLIHAELLDELQAKGFHVKVLHQQCDLSYRLCIALRLFMMTALLSHCTVSLSALAAMQLRWPPGLYNSAWLPWQDFSSR